MFVCRKFKPNNSNRPSCATSKGSSTLADTFRTRRLGGAVITIQVGPVRRSWMTRRILRSVPDVYPMYIIEVVCPSGLSTGS